MVLNDRAMGVEIASEDARLAMHEDKVIGGKGSVNEKEYMLNWFQESAAGSPGMDFLRGLEKYREAQTTAQTVAAKDEMFAVSVGNTEKPSGVISENDFNAGKAQRHEAIDVDLFGDNHANMEKYETEMARIDLLLNDNMLTDAYALLKKAEAKFTLKKSIYDQFMFKYSERGNHVLCKSIKDRMERKNIKPDITTYTALLEASISFGDGYAKKALTNTLAEMESNGVPLESISNVTTIGTERLSAVIEAVQVYKPFELTFAEDTIKVMKEHIAKHKLEREQPLQEEHSEDFKYSVRSYSKIEGVKDPKMIGMLKNLAALDGVDGMSEQEIQIKLENRGMQIEIDNIMQIREEKVNAGEVGKVREIRPLLREWTKVVEAKISSHIENVNEKTKNGVPLSREEKLLTPFLKTIEPQKMAYIGIQNVASNALREIEGVRFGNLALEIANKVYDQYAQDRRNTMLVNPRDTALQTKRSDTIGIRNLVQLQKESKFLWEQCQKIESPHLLRKFWRKVGFFHPEFGLADLEIPTWSNAVLLKLGAFVIEKVIDNCHVQRGRELRPLSAQQVLASTDAPLASQRAFHHSYVFSKTKKVGVINMHEKLREAMIGENIDLRHVHSTPLPMIAKPLPWTSHNKGGYYNNSKSVLRTPGQSNNAQTRLLARRTNDIHQVLDALNVLGSTPWRINSRVMEVVTHLWNTGGDNAVKIPTSTPTPYPTKPADFETNSEAQMLWKQEYRKIEKSNRELHSMRCDAQYKLTIADRLRSLRFYFPHNIDFRGRAYPIPPHLNHLGNDFCRGMLSFDEAKPLGVRGLYWLKVQLANVFGKDKLNLDDRVKFVDANMDNIIDSANNPLDGRKWWKEAADPFQLLAACMDLTDAYKLDDPTTHLSRLPVHQDGSCNGLQHYAALGGDVLGAEQVNVLPSDSPQDVYEACAKIVREMVASDVRSALRLMEKHSKPIASLDPNNPEAARTDEDLMKYIMELPELAHNRDLQHALLVEGKITRKVVKQTVMTNVYGVTFIGARQQIANRLTERKDIPEEYVYASAAYLTKKVFASMSTMFTGAKEIQDWLAENARLIASTGKPVHWVTPLGLPVVQVYAKDNSQSISSGIQNVVLKDEMRSGQAVNVVRQKSAFPPNFVHSLDATHMLMTAKACSERHLTFASVHDSYWTHGGTVDTMNECIRDQFVELHSQPILDNLLDYWKEYYYNLYANVNGREKPLHFSQIPKRGVIDLNLVKNSPYFFD
eukprot:CFRG6470T1